MDRRLFTVQSASWFALLSAGAWNQAYALSLADLSNTDATMGLKEALEKGAMSAIGILGAENGFLGNDRVRINLPGALNDAANLMRRFGQGGRVDELVTAHEPGC